MTPSVVRLAAGVCVRVCLLAGLMKEKMSKKEMLTVQRMHM